MEGRVTRAREKQRRQEEGIPDDPPKRKRQTIGQMLAEERENETKELLENEAVAAFEPFTNYDKDAVIAQFSATESDVLPGQLYRGAEAANAGQTPNIVFLTLETGNRPSTFTHFCNNVHITWNIEGLKIPSSAHLFGVPSVMMVFVRGEYVEGTTKDNNTYKYVGPIGVQSITSGSGFYLSVRFIFEFVLSKKDLAQFGANVMKCKKNKYGCSLCA